MCFAMSTPKVPDAPPVPSRDTEEARRRRAEAERINVTRIGQSGLIKTSGLGDPGYGKSTQRTTLGSVR